MKTIDVEEAARLVKEGSEITHKERMKLADERLRSLVQYARDNSPYLREKYKDLPENYTLSDIPVTEKAEMIEHFDSYATDRDISIKAAEEYCNSTSRNGKLYLDKYTVLHTSGTTGSPLFMVRDDHRNKLQGQLVAQRLLKGTPPDIMDHRKHKLAAVIYAANGSSSYESYLRQRAFAPGYEDNITAINVLEDTATIVKKLNEFQPEVMTGYASVLVMLGIEKQKGHLEDLPVKAIFNSAEAMTRDNHLFIEKAFGCPVKNNYCMTEGGEIAMTLDSPDMLLNEDFIIVEPCDENRNPVSDPAEWSQGILVTDLTNYVQPIIRYYVSDSVKIETIPDDQVQLPVLKINGRVNDIFELCGKPYSTAGIDSVVELHKGVLDFQFVQTGNDALEVRAVTAPDADREKVLKELEEELKSYFHSHGASDAVIKYSTELPKKKERGGKSPRYMDMRR